MSSGDQALVIAAHGSHLDPDSARPAFEHADAIREMDAFAEVREAFWKEEPAFREVLRVLESDRVFVVPLFMSEGYFVDRILPRELRMDNTHERVVEQDVHVTPPVGTHPAMEEVILHRATHIIGDDSVGPDVGLAVVGHGTERHPRSAASTRHHAARIRDMDRFASVESVFLDEPPEVGNLTDHIETTDIVVVPLFVADGYHTKDDIPRELGIRNDGPPYDRPAIVGDRRIWYAGAVGTDPRMADVVIERAAEAGASIDTKPATHSGGVYPNG